MFLSWISPPIIRASWWKQIFLVETGRRSFGRFRFPVGHPSGSPTWRVPTVGGRQTGVNWFSQETMMFT